MANARSNRAPALAPSRRLSPLGMRVTQAATEADIERITADYAAGPALAADAGFDGIEIHLGHNYLLSAFLSPEAQPPHRPVGRQPGRTGPASPARWSTAVREAVGDRVAVTAKLNMADGVPGGLWLDESVAVRAGCSRPTVPSTPWS